MKVEVILGIAFSLNTDERCDMHLQAILPKSKDMQQAPEEAHLHPSWAAKRKQSGAILSALTAAPKKIKFEEDSAAGQKQTSYVKKQENANVEKKGSGHASSQTELKVSM
jgi:hypothetical protein